MATRAMYLRMAKLGRPCHCVDGKWRTEKGAETFAQGYGDPLLRGMAWQKRAHYIAGIVAYQKARKGSR